MSTVKIGKIGLSLTKDIGIEVYKVVITPDEAAMILQFHSETKEWRNRRTSKRSVNRIIESIKENGVIVTHQGIAFSTEGILMDGKHRLISCIESNISFLTLLFMNVPMDAIEFIDTQNPRRFPDNLHMIGVNNAANVAAVTNLAQKYHLTKDTLYISRNHTTIKSKMSFFLKHREEIVENVRRAGRLVFKHPNLPFMLSEIAFISYQLRKIAKPEKVTEFTVNLVLENTGDEYNVFQRANNILGQLKRQHLKSRSRKHDAIHIMIQCWNEFITDGKCRSSFMTDTQATKPLPEILTGP